MKTFLVCMGFVALLAIAAAERANFMEMHNRVGRLEERLNAQSDVQSSLIDALQKAPFKPIPPGRQKIGD